MGYKSIGVDAGHDTEKDVPQQVAESLINIKYANCLKGIMDDTRKENPDNYFLPIMTRLYDTNKSIDLADRAEIMNKANVSAFISFHCNWTGRIPPNGFNIFYYQGSIGSKQLTFLISARLQQSGVNHWGKAEHIDTDAGCGKLFLLRHLIMPSVLIEVGFMSNPEDLKRIQEFDYIYRVCHAVYLGFGDYLI